MMSEARVFVYWTLGTLVTMLIGFSFNFFLAKLAAVILQSGMCILAGYIYNYEKRKSASDVELN